MKLIRIFKHKIVVKAEGIATSISWSLSDLHLLSVQKFNDMQ